MQKIAEFEVTEHFYIEDRGGFVIGKIKSGIFKTGMKIFVSEKEKFLTISGIEYLDKLKEKSFKNALIFKEKPSLEYVKGIFPVGSVLKAIE